MAGKTWLLTCVKLRPLAPKRCGESCQTLLNQRRSASGVGANTWHETVVERRFMFAAPNPCPANSTAQRQRRSERLAARGTSP